MRLDAALPGLKAPDASQRAASPLLSLVSDAAVAQQWSDVAERETFSSASPEVAYSLACHLVRSAEEAVPPAGPPLNSDPADVAAVRLRRLFTIAFMEPGTRLWAADDPELAYLKDNSEFKKLIGKIEMPTVTASATALYDQAKKVDLLDGYAAAAVNLLAGKNITTDDLPALHGSPMWTRLVGDVWNSLHDSYGFDDDELRIDSWLELMGGITRPNEPEQTPKRQEAEQKPEKQKKSAKKAKPEAT